MRDAAIADILPEDCPIAMALYDATSPDGSVRNISRALDSILLPMIRV